MNNRQVCRVIDKEGISEEMPSLFIIIFSMYFLSTEKWSI